VPQSYIRASVPGTRESREAALVASIPRTAEGVKRDFETSGGGQGTSVRRGDDNAFAYQSGSGDMYAGRDGEIYKKTGDGWSAVENPRTQSGAARAEGAGNSVMLGGDQQGAGRTAPDARARERNAQLDRDYRSRQNGFDRYAGHRGAGGQRMQRGGFGRRR